MMIITLTFVGFDKSFLIAFGGFWIILTLPTMYIHIQYHLRNRNQTLELFDDEILFIGKNDENYRFKTSDFKKIVIHQSGSLGKGAIQMLPFESYYYATLITKENQILMITSLMSSDLENDLRRNFDIPFEKKVRYMATLKV